MRVEEIPAKGITTLLLHQVTDTPIHSAHGEDNTMRPWVTPKEFEDLLTSLEAAGYHTVTFPQAMAYLKGGVPASTLPSRPLLITFDDGYQSAWTEATPILRKHHATAAMFFEGQLTDVHPARLTTPMLLAMEKSGVWYLQSHGWIGHGNIMTAAGGARNPYWYANLAWLPIEGRLETHEEYEQRIRADLRRFKQTFEPVLHQKIDVFAYPSGEYGQDGSLAPGYNPDTGLDMGHSNANDLTPLLYDALSKEGYTAAFVVSLPGMTHAASLQDNIFALPRVGIGEVSDKVLAHLLTDGIQLPEVSPAYTFNDTGPIALSPTGVWAASSANAVIYHVSQTGRQEKAISLPVLLDDRAGNPSLISALILNGSELTIVQQAGWWNGGQPRLSRFRIDGDQAVLLERHALPAGASWLVGAIRINGRNIGMTDEGRFIDVQSGETLITIALSDAISRHDRFAGPFKLGSVLYAYDRARRVLCEIHSDGSIGGTMPLARDLRNFASSSSAPDEFSAVDWSNSRHVLRRYRIVTQ